MKTDLSPDTDISLLLRADLPVIWDAFKAKAELVRATAETLTVTSIDQKEEMALARTTRLTLKEIRIAVEKKRVELGESHLKEIKKVNGAATAIKEFIEPLEARLLEQESFAERAEEKRIVELADSRYLEASAIRPQSPRFVKATLGRMPQADFDALIEGIKQEQAEIEAANRLRVEAERRLAEAQAEALRVAEVTRATIELAQRVALDEKNRRDAEALLIEQAVRAEAAKLMLAQQVEARAELDRANAIAEAKALETRRLAEAAQSLRIIEQARLDADLAEQKRIRDEQFAKLEAELAQANAAKQAEADAARKLALAPDVEQLRAFSVALQGIPNPELKTDAAKACLVQVSRSFADALFTIDIFCRE